MFTWEFLHFLAFILVFYLCIKLYVGEKEEIVKAEKNKLYLFNLTRYESKRLREFKKFSRHFNFKG